MRNFSFFSKVLKPVFKLINLHLNFFYIFLFFLFIILPCCSGLHKKPIISGKVISKASLYPVKEVNVVIQGSEVKTVTDSMGYYCLPASNQSAYQLIFFHANYDTTVVDIVRIDNSENYKINVALKKR